MNDFDLIQTAFRELPNINGLIKGFDDRSCEQLRKAVLCLNNDSESVGSGDLAGLVRHVLRRGSLVSHAGEDYFLMVPVENPWPNEQLWKASDVQILGCDQKAYRLKATRNWSAPWLPDSENFQPLCATFREDFRRTCWPSSPHLPLDTALQFGLRLPFSGYQGPGQRLAIRSAFFLKPGGTLVVNLPTGTGKSLVAWAPALLSNPNELTVMITPTVALAIDQEKQLLENYPNIPGSLPIEMAWHSGLNEDIRKAIAQRLRSNTQRILITSPESFVSSLSRVLYQTARQGLLRYFVVDEAHLVAQWGNDFRPDFQAMSGLRRDLVKHCPPGLAFRTLLLSATLTQESFDVLETLFSDGNFDSVNAAALRPEPEYWQSNSKTKQERELKVVELIRVVPRPFLLYVTTKRDAEFWYRKIRDLGIKRCGCVHGGTSSDERERVIDLWRSGGIECVVATSAFGLGMDKSNVRTVIHACIPESIDRFYQEVGRAGRDGRASISFFLPCEDADNSTAKSISQERIISLEKGHERWADLIKAGKFISDKQVWGVDLRTRPTHIQQDSDANVAWNLRTLVLLNRAGIIRFESHAPPDIERTENELERDFENRRQKVMENFFATAYITILNDGHLDKKTWKTIVQQERFRMYSASKESFERMVKLLSGKFEIGSLLSETYTVKTANGGSCPFRFCSGCTQCRTNNIEANQFYIQPETDLVTCIEHGNVQALQSLFRVNSRVVFVRLENTQSESERIRLCLYFIHKLVELGVDELAVPEKWKSKQEWKRVHEFSKRRFVVANPLNYYDHRKNDLRLPRATFLCAKIAPVVSRELLNMDRPFHIIFAPDDALEHITGRNFFSIRPHVRYYDLLQRLEQI